MERITKIIILTIVVLDPYSSIDYDEPNLYQIRTEEGFEIEVTVAEKGGEIKTQGEALSESITELLDTFDMFGPPYSR